MSAVIRADQTAGAGAGSNGKARNDLWVDVEVTLTEVGVGNVSWQWTLLWRPPGSTAVLATPALQSTTFTPDAKGSYRVRCVTDAGLPTEATTVKVFRVRYTADGANLIDGGYVVPAVDEEDGESNYDIDHGYGTQTNGLEWGEPIQSFMDDAHERLATVEGASDPTVPGRLTTAEGEIDALQVSEAALTAAVAAVTPVSRSGSVDFSVAQAWAPLGAVITQAASTATLYRLSVAVDHGLIDNGGDGTLVPATEALDLRVLVWRTAASVADFVVESGSAQWNAGDVDIRLVNAAGDWQIEVQKETAVVYLAGQIAQVRATVTPLVTVPWTSDTAPTVQTLGGGSVTAAAIIAEMVGDAFTGLLGAGIGGDGAGISDDGATGLQLDGAQATLAQGLLATAQSYLKRWANSSKVAYVMEDVGGVANALRQRFYDGAGAGTLARTLTHVAAGVVDTVVGTLTIATGGTIAWRPTGDTGDSLHLVWTSGAGPATEIRAKENRLFLTAGSGSAQDDTTRMRMVSDASGANWYFDYDGSQGLALLVNPAGGVTWTTGPSTTSHGFVSTTGPVYLQAPSTQICSLNGGTVANRCVTSFAVENLSATFQYESWTFASNLQTSKWNVAGYAARKERRFFYGETTGTATTALTGSFTPSIANGVMILTTTVGFSTAAGGAGAGTTIRHTFRIAAGVATEIGAAAEFGNQEDVAASASYHAVVAGNVNLYVIPPASVANRKWEAETHVHYIAAA